MVKLKWESWKIKEPMHPQNPNFVVQWRMTLEKYINTLGELIHELSRGQLNQLICHVNVHTALSKIKR